MSLVMNLSQGALLAPRRVLFAAGSAALLLTAAGGVAFAQGASLAGICQHLVNVFHAMAGCPMAGAS